MATGTSARHAGAAGKGTESGRQPAPLMAASARDPGSGAGLPGPPMMTRRASRPIPRPAQFGYGQLWTALWMLPLVIGVQEACGRIGNITGKGLARNIEDRYSLHTLRLLVVLLAAANVINIGAIGVGAALIIHIPASVLMVVLAFHRVLSRCPRVRGGRRRWCRSVRSRPRAMSPLAPEVHGDRIPVRIARRICVRRRSGVIARDMTASGSGADGLSRTAITATRAPIKVSTIRSPP